MATIAKAWACMAMAAIALLLGACDHIDSTRIPYAPVYLTFPTQAEWTLYGVSGAGQWQRYIKGDKVPTNFPYKATDQTGFGGLLVVSTYYGDLQCFDLACPVECKYNIRVAIDAETHVARCPQCHSEYDVFEMQGYPIAGPAKERNYGLRRYFVGRGSGTMEYMVITR